MRSIIHWALWERKWSIFWWSVGVAAYIALTIPVYSSVRDQAQALNGALTHLSPATKALFSDTSDWISPVGYLSSKVFYLIIPLLFSMLAIGLASSLIAREEQDGTLELLLARPVSRARLQAAKLFSGFIILITVAGVTALTTIFCAAAIQLGIPLWRLVLVSMLAMILASLFGAIAWLLSSLGKFGRRMSVGVAALIALGSYLISSLESLANWLKWPAKLLPYHYYRPAAVLEGTYNWLNALGLVLTTLILLALAFLAFRRRDLG